MGLIEKYQFHLIDGSRGGSRGRVQGGARGAPPPPPPPLKTTCGFLIQLVFCEKRKKNYLIY